MNIEEMHFGFVHEKGTTDVIFIARRLKKTTFDRVHRKVLWWALRIVGVEK